jgi:isopenicillin N synthase-like dioxygenase
VLLGFQFKILKLKNGMMLTPRLVVQLLMRWSNDVLQSNPHKADYKDSGKSGYMTAFFAHPSYEEIISCLPAFKGEQELYEPIKSLDYLNMRISSTYK